MELGINLGSGQRKFRSNAEIMWVNVDSQQRWNPDVCCDAANTHLEEGKASFVVLHHVLEHFGCGEGRGLIGEAYRLLAPGGSMLVFVPNMKALAQAWVAGNIDDFIFMVNSYGAYMGDEADRHKWGFTAMSLTNELRCMPWAAVRQFDWRSIPGADLARDWWILDMEAIK